MLLLLLRLYGLSFRLCILSSLAALYLLVPGGSSGLCYLLVLLMLLRLYGLSFRLFILSSLAALYLLVPGGSSGLRESVKSFCDFSIFLSFISIAWIFASVLENKTWVASKFTLEFLL